MEEGFAMLKESYVAAPRARRAYYNNTEGFVAAPRARRAYYNNTEGFVAAPVARKQANEEYNDTTTNESTTTTEGFVSSNNKAYGPEFESSKSPGYIMRPDTWAMPTLSYSKGTVPSTGAQDILNRNNPPLTKGEMDIFANTPFKPECCPNTFSSSEGCACMDMKQYGTLVNRGGNNVPYSEY
jgi:hypothetical protein